MHMVGKRRLINIYKFRVFTWRVLKMSALHELNYSATMRDTPDGNAISLSSITHFLILGQHEERHELEIVLGTRQHQMISVGTR